MSVSPKPRVNSLDLLIGILKFVAERHNEISCTTPNLQNAIYNLSQKDEFAEYFNDYRFQQRGYYHFSENLLADLRNLERLECISAKNPRFVHYTLHLDILKRFFERTYSEKQHDGYFDLKTLEDMAGEICAQLVCQNTSKHT